MKCKIKVFRTCEEELYEKLRILTFVKMTEVMDNVFAKSTEEHKGATHAHSFMLFQDGLNQ